MTEPDDHRMLRYLRQAVPLGEHSAPWGIWTVVRLDVLQWAVSKLVEPAGVPTGVLLAITNAGFTLTQTQYGYELRKLGEVKAQ